MLTNQLPVADLDEALAQVDPHLLDLLPVSLCQRLRILPMARKGNALVIGFYDKLTSQDAYQIQLASGLRVISVRLKKQASPGADLQSLLGGAESPRLARPCVFSS
ncbi:hypothetical protein JST97_30555 [bacterium]|nr:hypothetical protein [bacterium]